MTSTELGPGDNLVPAPERIRARIVDDWRRTRIGGWKARLLSADNIQFLGRPRLLLSADNSAPAAGYHPAPEREATFRSRSASFGVTQLREIGLCCPADGVAFRRWMLRINFLTGWIEA
jgi:hypothetical protein